MVACFVNEPAAIVNEFLEILPFWKNHFYSFIALLQLADFF